MLDLPDPKSPLNNMDKLVYGHNAIRHPITGFPLQMGGYDSAEPAPPPNFQAREHLKVVARWHGDEVAKQMKARLEAWEAAGNTVSLPTDALPIGFEHALRR